MRPLTLRLRGVRSYLAERTVDFSELGLVADHRTDWCREVLAS